MPWRNRVEKTGTQRPNAVELLGVIKADGGLDSIPVVVVSTSQLERRKKAAYAKHAAAFISKPVGLDRFVTIAEAIEDFWFSVLRLPSCELTDDICKASWR
jgi:CheY-like chemotaxis protein